MSIIYSVHFVQSHTDHVSYVIYKKKRWISVSNDKIYNEVKNSEKKRDYGGREKSNVWKPLYNNLRIYYVYPRNMWII